MLSKLAGDVIRARHVDDETLHKPRMYVPEYAPPSEAIGEIRRIVGEPERWAA